MIVTGKVTRCDPKSDIGFVVDALFYVKRDGKTGSTVFTFHSKKKISLGAEATVNFIGCSQGYSGRWDNHKIVKVK